TASGSGELRTNIGGMTSGLRSQQFQVEKLIEQAIKRQEVGDSNGAAELYEQAVSAGMERADIFYSLGLIYQERGDHKAAVGMLNRAASDPEYALSSHFALGQSYRDLNLLPQAAQEFEQTIRLVDMNSIGRAESDDLINMYESAATIYSEIGDIARAAALYGSLSSFLETKRWGRERAAEFKARAKELSERNMFAKLRTIGTGALTPQQAHEAPPASEETMPGNWGKIRPITDFLRNDRPATTSGLSPQPEVKHISEPLLILETMPTAIEPHYAPATPLDTTGLDIETTNWVSISGKYLDQGQIEAALDACHEVIRINLDYLPIHLRMGEIYERQGRPEEALSKYQLLIDTYRARNEAEKAVDVYYRFIELSPDTINARTRLAEILKNTGRIDDAVEQSIYVANTYYRLGQSNKALEEYRRLLQWAPRNREVHSQYGLALLKLERFEAALGEFRKALELGSPDDLIAIARLNITLALMGDQPADVWDSLATLLDQIKQRPQEFGTVQSEYRSALLIAEASILHYILAIIQQHSKQHNSALQELEQARSMLGDDPDPLLHPVLIYQAAADSYIALGDAEEALAQLHKGQAVAGRNPAAPTVKHAFAVPLSKGDLARRMAEA
ncbi:MAG: tetratricopeptide repeat protein, partial [Oscillochloris sp.]|nr:tetratricopeptide repeat protein [Oscillochloris sp.]